jgi:predicted RNA-binding protein YlqC (UPF0109 family)
MENLVKYIVSKLVEDESKVEVVSENESEKVVVIKVMASKDDMGKIIGRNGKIANGIRTIVKSASLKSGKRYIVKVLEKESV